MEKIERDSFIVYRSYWEGLRRMDKDVQCEVYNAIMEYGFNGNIPEMSPTAQGIFILMKPNIDVSLARYKNGRKGGNATASKKNTTRQQNKPLLQQMTYDDEATEMLENKTWSETVCMQLQITEIEFKNHVKEFIDSLKLNTGETGHENINDAHRHFVSWMRKVYPVPKSVETKQKADYTFKGGFGGQDT